MGEGDGQLIHLILIGAACICDNFGYLWMCICVEFVYLFQTSGLVFNSFSLSNVEQFTMEMKGAELGPRSYSLNMFKDFVPMCIFSESKDGEVL